MNQTATLALGLSLLLLAGSAAAETVYVTDKLYLGLYNNEGATGRPPQTLVSGTALEVLERGQRVVKVRTPDGTVGWTKAAYLVKEKPPRLMLAEAEARNAALAKQLHDARAELTDTEVKTTALQARATAALAATEHDQAELEQLRGENREYRARAADYRTSIPLVWFLATAAAALLLGFTAGLVWLDQRIRKRHGGFRIY